MAADRAVLLVSTKSQFWKGKILFFDSFFSNSGSRVRQVFEDKSAFCVADVAHSLHT